ncbi:hypothetical protein [Aliiruegeria lutimaris]|uniref:Uncharacterized protein n=1 Tax=Aliiruegeria lutimaris TaxID=571298 RepID=A0A1G9PFG6_9RHOB|nr:hypothetical protein [Aliiruegeria lutimaris]SDL97520.1 hypothetical protein SAMN04488026_11405 [Aliiruegeria lutimaris]
MNTRFFTDTIGCATVVAFWVFGGLQAMAEPQSQRERAIEEALAAGDGRQAIELAEAILNEVWDAAPLGLNMVSLVEGNPSGYGIFTPRETNRYAPSEPIVIYAEPYGFGYGELQEGIHRIAFDVDLVVKASDGTVLTDLPDIMELALNTRRPNKEFFADITYKLTGASVGQYILETTLRDQNSESSVSFELLIEIAE